MSDVRTTFDEYAAWFSWARTNLVRDAVVCHAAASAASSALDAGANRGGSGGGGGRPPDNAMSFDTMSERSPEPGSRNHPCEGWPPAYRRRILAMRTQCRRYVCEWLINAKRERTMREPSVGAPDVWCAIVTRAEPGARRHIARRSHTGGCARSAYGRGTVERRLRP